MEKIKIIKKENSHTETSLVAQRVKDPALSPQQLGWLLWCGFDLWPRNFYMMPPTKKEKKKIAIPSAYLELNVISLILSKYNIIRCPVRVHLSPFVS